MTAHEFANQLLAGPDLPILFPGVLEFDEDDEACRTPCVNQMRGMDADENPADVLVLSGLYREGD